MQSLSLYWQCALKTHFVANMYNELEFPSVANCVLLYSSGNENET